MSSTEELQKCARSLKAGQDVYRSLSLLLRTDTSLKSFEYYGIKQLALRYSKDVRYTRSAKNLIDRIQKMEDDSRIFRKPYDVRRPGNLNRKRLVSSSTSSRFTTKLPEISVPTSSDSNGLQSSQSSSTVKKEPILMEVSKLEGLEESDYDSVRPTLVTLSAKQLKSFMDRNPGIEKIGDGLFRRHCQIDCPEEVPKKLKMETWRTVHDVYINWKMYKEAKVWEKNLNEALNQTSKLESK